MLSDPMRWSLPLGRLFGINIRVHILFFIVHLLRRLVDASGEMH